MVAVPEPNGARAIGRYVLYGEIASGGMATVHFGRLQGAAGFERSVAIKRLHPQFAKDPEFVAMFLDEARLAARISHPNVIPTLDVVAQGDELFLVMEYVRGVSLSRLVRAAKKREERIPLKIVASIVSGMLNGLHAAHEAKSETGEALHIVHRDVSPQNVLVGTDGIARVLDFGVAKAVGRVQGTREGQLKGKLPYMAPEQVTTGVVSRTSDIYAASVVLWEVLAGRRLYSGDNEANVLSLVLSGEIEPPSHFAPDIPPEFDRIVLQGLNRDPNKRFATAREMATAVESIVGLATNAEIGEWVERLASDELRERAQRIEEVERSRVPSVAPPGSALPSYTLLDSIRCELQTVTVGGVSVDASHVSEVQMPTSPQCPGLGTAAVGPGLPSLDPPHVSSFTPPANERFRARAVSVIAASVVVIGLCGAVLVERARIDRSNRRIDLGLSGADEAAISVDGVARTGRRTANAVNRASSTPLPSAPPIGLDPKENTSRYPPKGAFTSRAPDCTPPYSTDDKGHVHFKPECM